MKNFIVSDENSFILSSTSKGNQEKWILQEGNKVVFLKANTMGYEGIAEALVSEFLKYVEGIDFVDYWLCSIESNGIKKYGCYSYSMLAEGEELVSLYRLLKAARVSDNVLQYTKGIELVNLVVNTVLSEYGVDITDLLQKTVYLDSIIYNEDRHLNNICLIKDSKGGLRCAPIFDNGLSLLSDVGDYGDSLLGLESKIRRVKARPFSTSFSKQVSYFEGDLLRIRYDEFKDVFYDLTIDGYPDKYQQFFIRAKRVLLHGLNSSEGKVWIRA